MYCHNCSQIAIKGRQHVERGECYFFAINLDVGINVYSCLYYQDLVTESSIFTSLLENFFRSCPWDLLKASCKWSDTDWSALKHEAIHMDTLKWISKVILLLALVDKSYKSLLCNSPYLYFVTKWFIIC